MNAKISVFVICVEAILNLLLYNLYDCTFNSLYGTHFINMQVLTAEIFLIPKSTVRRMYMI